MENLSAKIEEVLGHQAAGNFTLSDAIQPGKIFIQAQPGIHRKILQDLLDADPTTVLIAISGVDVGEALEVLHHFRTMGTVLTVRTEIPKDEPTIESIIDILPGANLHEKEVADLFGVVFEGNPLQGHFILPDAWPQGNYPLRKDAEIPSLESMAVGEEVVEEESGDVVAGQSFNVILGPQHPALLEPEKFVLKVEGEIVTGVTPRLGYVHRGVEKASETRTYMQDMYMFERICGICNTCHLTTFCQAVESILGTDVPPRAKYLRTVALELNRLHSHMLLYGHAGLEIGFETLFQYAWRDREAVMDLIEMLTGNRVNQSYITIGGVKHDITDAQIHRIKPVLATLEEKMVFYKDLYANDASLHLRTKNIGVLSYEDALKLCVVGPVARASGVATDVRKDDPYAAYDEIPFKVITYPDGDTWARLILRIDEIYESIHIINYALDNLPAGDFRVKVPRSVPAGEAVSHVEAPRGEVFYYLKSNGTQSPERVKVRTPTFANLPAFLYTAGGLNVADVPASFVSLDPCFSCTDR